jgi:hypothetical protein
MVSVLTLFNVWLQPTQLGLKGKAVLSTEVENSFAHQAEPSGSLGEPTLSVNVAVVSLINSF